MKQLIFITLIFLQCTVWAFDATKEIERQFVASDFNEFRISNEYGNLVFLPTRSDSILVKVHIVADVIEISDTSELFRYIETAMYTSKQTLIVKTGFDTDLNDAAHVSVHYTIYLPDTMNLSIKNRYGDISLFDIYGTKKIKLEYGKITCGDILCPSFPASSISLSFASLIGNNAGILNLNINNGSIQLDQISTSTIQSSFSVIQIKNSEKLVCKSLNDKYALDTVQNLTITGENTIASIIHLTKKLQLDFTSGNVSIKDVSSEFDGIDINALNAEATINTSAKSNYSINALTQYGSFTYPDYFAISILKDMDKTMYQGMKKNDASIQSQIGIVGKNSTIILK